MFVGVLLILIGALGGAFVGVFGALLGMALVGGGHSHSDMFVPFGTGALGLFLGAILGPIVIISVRYGMVTRQRCRRSGEAPPKEHAAAAFQAIAAAVSGFGAFVASYYSSAIAELRPENGGPIDNPDPAGRARWTMILAGLLALAAIVLLVRAFIARPRYPLPEAPD